MLMQRDRETKQVWPRRSGSSGEALVFLATGCVVLAAFNLRPALTSTATMIAEIQHGLGLADVWMGALTTMPVLCFGIFGPLAPLLSARVGLERALALLFLSLGAGLGIRLVPHALPLFAGTLIAGAAIGMAGVLLPVVIRRRFQTRVGAMTGLYTMVLSVGGASAAGLTPLLGRAWNGWTFALAGWSIPAVIAAGLWALLASADAGAPSHSRPPHFSLLLRDRLAWYVTAYMGLQAGLAFIVLGWLPTLLRDRGLDVVDAGAVTSASILAQAVTALIAPSLATRRLSPRLLIVLVHLSTAVGFLGLLFAPTGTRVVWALFLGLGQGGLFGLALLFVTLRSSTADVTAMLSGMSQSIGYLGASVCPFAVGLLRGGQHSLAGPALIVTAIAVLSTWCGLKAAAPKVVLPNLNDD